MLLSIQNNPQQSNSSDGKTLWICPKWLEIKENSLTEERWLLEDNGLITRVQQKRENVALSVSYRYYKLSQPEKYPMCCTIVVNIVICMWNGSEAETGIEPTYKDLQSSA